MKKRTFWFVMCLLSLLNGTCFYWGSLAAMAQGIEGADNQAALLFIPILWITAVLVLITLNIYTLLWGRKIHSDCRIRLWTVFCFAGLKGNKAVVRVVFLTITLLLMLFGYALFASYGFTAAAYALSGGLLLLCLYQWQSVGMEGVSC